MLHSHFVFDEKGKKGSSILIRDMLESFDSMDIMAKTQKLGPCSGMDPTANAHFIGKTIWHESRNFSAFFHLSVSNSLLLSQILIA